MSTNTLPEIPDVLILGAGASGLICAQRAAAKGKSVLLIDHAAKPGLKLAVTGGGKCNFTNRQLSPGDYIGENPDFCRSALARFRPEHITAKLAAANIAIEEREHGQLFCERSAADLVRLLVEDCKDAGCRMLFGEKILEAMRPEGNRAGFQVRTSAGTYQCRNLVVALGGPAWPQIGATGIGLELARGFGHRITPIRPALAGLVMPQSWPFTGLEGISLPVDIQVLPRDADDSGKSGITASKGLALLFTHRGISGPAALQASLYWQKGMRLIIDFLPGQKLERLLNAPGAGKLLCRSLLRRHFPHRLADALCPPEAADLKCASLSRAAREELHRAVHARPVIPERTEGFAKAEVTAGGVSTEAVSSRSMESRLVPGLYFCGEVLDVTGRLGGYNLHWAFASGAAAGEALGEIG